MNDDCWRRGGGNNRLTVVSNMPRVCCPWLKKTAHLLPPPCALSVTKKGYDGELAMTAGRVKASKAGGGSREAVTRNTPRRCTATIDDIEILTKDARYNQDESQ